jgi:hypothetical protein
MASLARLKQAACATAFSQLRPPVFPGRKIERDGSRTTTHPRGLLG